ncbi:MAG: glycosyltransferase [Planctomycetota bacterium]|jgi:glycosyltransferase involved in cell wall biosynthesis
MDKKTIKVVHILEGFVGGARTYACTVLPRLVERGFDVTLICSLNRGEPDAPARVSELAGRGVKVHVVPMSRSVCVWQDLRSVVHTHCSKAGALGRLAAVLAGPRAIIHSPHCFAFLRRRSPFEKSLYLNVERLLGLLTTKLAAVSQSEAAVAVNRRIVPRRKCVAIRNGLSDRRCSGSEAHPPQASLDRVLPGIRGDAAVVTTACRLVEYKGVLRFLQAAKSCRTNNAVFLVAGEGELKGEAQKFISENKLDDKVKLLGYISKMDQLYAVSDVVVLCSDSEAQPYLLLEAMRARCPVVATAVTGNNELIAHEETGLLVEATPTSIAAAIDELLADKAKRDEYAENAYAYFRKYHTVDKQVSELADLYERCVLNGCERYSAARPGAKRPPSGR